MVLQVLASFGYSLVESSWMVSTVAVKYFLFAGLVYAFSKKENYFEQFRSFIEEFSQEFVSIMVIAGFLALAGGLKVSPLASVFSHVLAAVYFGYLFWEF
ncbi:MAG: hypothetical protein ACI8Z7_000026 [Candidatus Nanohaloarchaea archaeon]|jgi:hypothetical protein